MNKSELHKDAAIVDRIGRQRLVEFTGMTRQAIDHWRKKGIPRAWMAAISGLPRRRG